MSQTVPIPTDDAETATDPAEAARAAAADPDRPDPRTRRLACPECGVAREFLQAGVNSVRRPIWVCPVERCDGQHLGLFVARTDVDDGGDR